MCENPSSQALAGGRPFGLPSAGLRRSHHQNTMVLGSKNRPAGSGVLDPDAGTSANRRVNRATSGPIDSSPHHWTASLPGDSNETRRLNGVTVIHAATPVAGPTSCNLPGRVRVACRLRADRDTGDDRITGWMGGRGVAPRGHQKGPDENGLAAGPAKKTLRKITDSTSPPRKRFARQQPFDVLRVQVRWRDSHRPRHQRSPGVPRSTHPLPHAWLAHTHRRQSRGTDQELFAT